MRRNWNSPHPNVIADLQRRFKHTDEQAAESVHVDVSTWRAWVRGKNAMHPAFFELYARKGEESIKRQRGRRAREAARQAAAPPAPSP